MKIVRVSVACIGLCALVTFSEAVSVVRKEHHNEMAKIVDVGAEQKREAVAIAAPIAATPTRTIVDDLGDALVGGSGKANFVTTPMRFTFSWLRDFRRSDTIEILANTKRFF